MVKENVVFIHNGILFYYKKVEFEPLLNKSHTNLCYGVSHKRKLKYKQTKKNRIKSKYDIYREWGNFAIKKVNFFISRQKNCDQKVK